MQRRASVIGRTLLLSSCRWRDHFPNRRLTDRVAAPSLPPHPAGADIGRFSVANMQANKTVCVLHDRETQHLLAYIEYARCAWVDGAFIGLTR